MTYGVLVRRGGCAGHLSCERCSRRGMQVLERNVEDAEGPDDPGEVQTDNSFT